MLRPSPRAPASPPVVAATALVMVLFAAACSGPTATGPAAPANAAAAHAPETLLQTRTRSAVADFVEAYRATVAGGDDLVSISATPLMRRFARWLGITNATFPGDITATSNVMGIGVARRLDADVVEIDLAATIDVSAQPPEGEALQLTVPLDGPIRLASTVHGWRVVDFVRFGVPVSGAFLPLDLEYRRQGVDLTLDSFSGVPNWSFFVRIEADGSAPVTLAEDDVNLIDAEGDVVAPAIEVSPPLLEIDQGEAAEGALTFEPLPALEEVALRIDLGGRGGPAPLEVPLDVLDAS